MCSVSETADREQLAQLQILNKAKQRQIEDLERKLEDTRRNMRYVEHQFAIVKGKRHTVLFFFLSKCTIYRYTSETSGSCTGPAGCAACAIVTFCLLSTDEKEDLAVSLKESGLLIEEAKEREVQMQSKLKTMGQQVKVLTDRDQEVSSALTHTALKVTAACTSAESESESEIFILIA